MAHSASPHATGALAPDHLGSPALDLLGTAMFSLQWGDQNWTRYPSVVSQVSYRWEGACLLASLFLTQPRSVLATFAARMHCWLIVGLSTRTLRAFSAELLPSQSALGCAAAQGYPCPGVGPAFALVDFLVVPDEPFLQPEQVPLNGSPAFLQGLCYH